MLHHGFKGVNMGSNCSMGFEGMLLSTGFKLAIFITLVVVGIKLFKHYTNKTNATLQILNERFAKGEIGEEEYLKKKTILSQKN